MEETFTGAEAIKYIAEYFNVSSMYALAKSLSDDKLKIQPIQISNYKAGKSMSRKVAMRFLDVYGVVITDIYTPGTLNK